MQKAVSLWDETLNRAVPNDPGVEAHAYMASIYVHLGMADKAQAEARTGVALAERIKKGAESTADEVLEGVDLSGKRVLVTGVSAGLGVEPARSVVAYGTVVGTARDLEKARRALWRA